MEKTHVLEVCAGDIQSVLAAHMGGAQRVELCSALDEGGLTPSAGLIRQACQVEGMKVHVLIRPRSGHFVYTDQEVDIMADDISFARQYGASGVVIGALTPDGDMDYDVCAHLMKQAQGMDVTFHRAFDLCRDPMETLNEIIRLGCSRVLTSGQAPTAEQGVPLLSQLVEVADCRIGILAGSGVSSANARKIMQATGVMELHASARRPVESVVRYFGTNVTMGARDAGTEGIMCTSVEEVKKILVAMNS